MTADAGKKLSGRQPATRRRGKALETAILNAAWEDLIRVGYTDLTLEAVAVRAQTSRPVLSRRWSNRGELVRAAIHHYIATHPIAVPECGDVRQELILFLRGFIDRATPMLLIGGQMAEYYREEHSSPAELRNAIVHDRHVFDGILDRAVARGEIDKAKLTPRIAAIPLDLVRHDLMVRLAPPPDEVLREVVDDIFMPLVATAK